MNEKQNAEQSQEARAAGSELKGSVRPVVSVEELRELCTLTVELVRLRQNECKHLCVENLGPEILHDLLSRLVMSKRGWLRAPVAADLGMDA